MWYKCEDDEDEDEDEDENEHKDEDEDKDEDEVRGEDDDDNESCLVEWSVEESNGCCILIEPTVEVLKLLPLDVQVLYLKYIHCIVYIHWIVYTLNSIYIE